MTEYNVINPTFIDTTDRCVFTEDGRVLFDLADIVQVYRSWVRERGIVAAITSNQKVLDQSQAHLDLLKMINVQAESLVLEASFVRK